MFDIQIAAQYFQNGNIATAEKLLLASLKKYPKNVDIFHMLGLIKIQGKSLNQARQYFESAVAISPDNFAILFNYANLLSEMQNSIKAAEIYEKCLRIDQSNPVIWQGFGVALHNSNDFKRALYAFERAVELESNNNFFLINLAGALSELGRDAEALTKIEASLSIKVTSAALKNKVAILTKLNLFDEAENAISSALELNENDVDVLLSYAELLLRKKEFLKSEDYFCRVLRLQPENLRAKRGNAIALAEQGKLYEAHLIAKNIAENHTVDANNWMILGAIYKHLGLLQESRMALERSIEMDVNLPEAHYNLGHVFLEQFQFEKGWKEYEYRWLCKDFGSNEFVTVKPRWDGVQRDGTLLVWAEQGIGDQVLYASFLGIIKTKVNNLIVALDPRLLSLFESCNQEISFISKDEITSDLIFDWHISIGDSVQHVCHSQECFKKRSFPYIEPSPSFNFATKFSFQASEKKKLIGLSWLSSNVKYSNFKSLDLKELLPILKIEGANFIDIGYVDSEEQRKVIFEENKVLVHKIDDFDSFNDIDGLANIIDSTDFIVTTSNTCAHIAGALGKKTYLLLPRYLGRFWYWHSSDSQSLWYPSISIFMQDENGEWGSTIELLRQEILNDWA